MEYKREKDEKFRYMIKNGTTDLEVMCKSLNNNGPYGRIDLGVLCAVPKLKLITPRPSASIDKDKDDFIKVTSKKAKKSGRAVSKARLFQRLYRFTNYLEPVSDESLSEDDSL